MADNSPELYDLEAENALVGAALFDLSVFLDCGVAPDDFRDRGNRDIWRAGQKLAKQGIQADQVTVLNALPDPDLVGGFAGIHERMSAVPNAFNAKGYAEIVKDKAEQRRLLALANDIARGASKDPGTRRRVLRQALEDTRALLTDMAGGAPDWTLYTLTDAFAPRKRVDYAVEGLFSLPSVSIVYGAPGTLKSFLLLDMALCVAAGLPWLESLPDSDAPTAFKTIPLPGLWLDFDNGKRRTHERVEALSRARDLDAEATAFYYASMPSPWLQASNAASMDGLILLCKERNIGLVVVDNLRAVSGDMEENASEMSNVMLNFRRLAEETGAAVVIIHHQRKGSGDKERPGDALRGHSSIEQAIDLALQILRDGDSERISIRSTKTRDVVVLPFGAEFSCTHKDGTNELETARLYGFAIEDTRSPAAIQAAALSVVEEHGEFEGKGKLAIAIKETGITANINTVRDEIDRIAKEGILDSDGKRPMKFTVPPQV